MRLQTFFGKLAESTPFTDIPLEVHWYGDTLYDNDYKVGEVIQGYSIWEAYPYWEEDPQFFDTQEEAQAWLVAMYKMGGKDEPRQHRRTRRPAAK